jgi:hypothetical protein
MHVSVLMAGFTLGICVFGGWLMVMLRHDRAHRVALVAAAHEHTRSHRRATLSARYTPEVTPEVAPELPVVRAGSFCRVPGNFGYGKDGSVLVCEARGSGRPRWRRHTTSRAAA